MADLASMVIGLRADVAQLQSDLGKATDLNRRYAQQAAQAWNSAGSAVADSLRDIAGKVAAAFAVDKLVEFGKQAIDTADQLGKMAQKVGVSVESLSALRVQANLSDVSVEELQGGLAKLARNAADAASGSKQQAAAFQAMGVSLKDASGNLKSTETLLGEVSAKFADYRDSASKTALAQQLFGKSGAELIPLLNQLGTQGFAKAREEAEKYGAVITGDMAQASNQFNDNITKLKLETQGFAIAVTQQLLPGLNALTSQMVQAGQTTDRYGESSTITANAIKSLVLGLISVKEIVASVATILQGFYESVKGAFDASYEIVKAWSLATYQEIKSAFSFDGAGIDAAEKQYQASLSSIRDKAAQSFGAIKEIVGGGLGDSVKNVRDTFSDLFGTFSNVTGGANTTAKALGNLNAPLVENADAAEKAKKALDDYNKAQLDAASFLARLQGGIDPVNKAYEDYVASIIQANKISQQLIDTGTKAGHAQEAYALATQFATQANAAANKVLDENLDKLARQADVLGRVQKELADQAALAGLTDRERFIADAVQKATDEWNKNTEAHIQNKQSLDDLILGTKTAAARTYDLTEAAKQSREVWAGWASIIQGAASSVSDAFAKALVEGGSLLKSLADVAKQVVEQIISYFLKLAIINPILNSIFGGVFGAAGGSLLPTFASAVGSAFGGSGEVGVSGGTTTGGGSFDLFTAGKTIWNGFQNGYQSFFQGDSAFTMGPPTEAGSTSSYYGGGYSSGFGQALGIAGGVYAGYNEFNRAGGGVAGVAGGAAYGYGTYALGAGIATLATTGSLTAAFAAIPVVGWIAIAAMLIDKFSGGKLFGTKGTVQGGSTALNIDATGANYATGISLKGQKALFGGAKWSWQDIPETPEQAAAAQAFFDSMTKTMKQYAGQFGVKAGDLVAATFEQEFDKKGNPTGVTHATIAGYKYENLTGDQFSQAYLAANQLTVLDQFDSKLESTIAEFRKSADTLVQIANGLTEAEGYLQSGGDLLAIAGKDTLSSIVTLASGMQQAGETIDQTIDRLIKAQVQYDQFVAQFKPAAHYVDDFEQTLSGINQQMLANIKQANALAQAAGAAGASEQDLANIHKYAAQQAAQAIAALEASAQSLAFSLGLTTVGSLDEVNSEIAALQAKANQGGSAVRNFGSAMTDAAQAAKNAMDLLLGDLSPLNDQQKLQKALAGLRQGSVSQEQVLEIGRRLYASTAQYTSLFNMVMQMGPGTHASSVGGGIAGGNQGGGLSGAERDRLNTLLKEQQQLQAAAQLQQYRTLAQQIAEIASAKGEDWRQVLKDMGINIADFERGLNLNDQQTSDYIDAIQKQTDDFGENTTSLIAALNALTVALGGTPPADDGSGSGSGDGSPPRTPPGHSGHSRSYQDGRDLARGFRDALNDVLPRGGRQQTARGTARVGG